MISLGYFRRHAQATGASADVALLDVAQEYVLEHLRREGFFDETLVFKGGTALRKFVFGRDGRFSVDLDFGLRVADPDFAGLVLDAIDGMELHGVRVRLARRKGVAAQLLIDTPLGAVTEPAAISVRLHVPWLPAPDRQPMPFEFLDRGLIGELVRAPLPILDPREIAAEKLAAFWRRRMARDLYDLEHLGRALQADFDGEVIASLGLLKIYFDVVDDGVGHPLPDPTVLFSNVQGVQGREDLGHLRADVADVGQLLVRCQRHYRAITATDPALVQMVAACSTRDRQAALRRREELVHQLSR